MIALVIDIICDGCPWEPAHRHQSAAIRISSAETEAREQGWDIKGGRHVCAACVATGRRARSE